MENHRDELYSVGWRIIEMNYTLYTHRDELYFVGWRITETVGQCWMHLMENCALLDDINESLNINNIILHSHYLH